VRLPMRLDERPPAAGDPLASPQVGLNRITSKLLDAPNVADTANAPVAANALANGADGPSPANHETEPAAQAPAHADA
jgi:hypothetical protein